MAENSILKASQMFHFTLFVETLEVDDFSALSYTDGS
jgi:hypothetical protein